MISQYIDFKKIDIISLHLQENKSTPKNTTNPKMILHNTLLLCLIQSTTSTILGKPSSLRGSQKDETVANFDKRTLSQSCNPPIAHWIGDGWCDPDERYNNEACGYDGGDCCAETCKHNDYDCSQPFDCKDPSTLPNSCNAKLEIKFTNQINFVYKDSGTGANNDFSAWRPVGTNSNGWYSIGDVGMSSHGAPKTALLVKGDSDILTKPIGYNLIWKDSGSGGHMDASFWEPIPATGYSCLGHVVQPNYSKPSTDLIRCVKEEYLQAADRTWVWNDRGSGAHWDASVYQATPNENIPALAANTFITARSHNPPDSSKFKVLDWKCIEGVGFNADAQTVGIEIAQQYAPKIYLHSEEKYFPSSVEFFEAETTVQKINDEPFKVTNQGLGCSTCTEPAFLDGQKPGGVPIYSIAVPKGLTDEDLEVVDLVYYLFFPYNAGKDICIGVHIPYFGCAGGYSNFGNHVGDWEHMTVRFIDGHPHQVYLSFHSDGRLYYFGDKNLELQDGHSVVYSAKGSHGLYAFTGSYKYGKAWTTDLVDHMNKGIVWETKNNVKFTPYHNIGEFEGEWSFMNFAGRWGNPKDSCYDIPWAGEFCLLEPGPTGPMKKSATNPNYFDLS
uniref:LNR domain-containing protein n=1 Tax=Ditylum brightwellii TaxID=49249 RepID=A0A7S4W2V0_9STRA